MIKKSMCGVAEIIPQKVTAAVALARMAPRETQKESINQQEKKEEHLQSLPE